MSLIEDIGKTIKYIEDNLDSDIEMEAISSNINISEFYLQRAFSIMCGISISEYVRNRRLTMAGIDLYVNNLKVIDTAIKYGYESPDSFTKAFTRFHGITPIQAKNKESHIRIFEPFKITFEIKGGFDMESKIIRKESFDLIGSSKMIRYQDGYMECPKFWDEHYKIGKGKIVCGMFAVCMDSNPESGMFKYAIADLYDSKSPIPEGFEKITIPESTWAIFKCVGPLPSALQEVNTKIFKEWLPNNPDFEIAAPFNIEAYTDVRNYKLGNEDPSYVSEIWIPVKEKK